jgi:hypothetical protein
LSNNKNTPTRSWSPTGNQKNRHRTVDNYIRAVLVGVVELVGDEFFDDGLQGLCEICDDLVWFAVPDQRGGEEAAGGRIVASWRDKHVDDLAMLIHGSVDVAPSTSDLHVSSTNHRPPTGRRHGRAASIRRGVKRWTHRWIVT